MNYEYYSSRGKNWFTAMGSLFSIMAIIVLIQQLLIVGPDFVEDHLLNNNVTNEKISLAMLSFGVFMIILGFKKHNVQKK